MRVHACNPRTGEIGAGRPEMETSLSYTVSLRLAKDPRSPLYLKKKIRCLCRQNIFFSNKGADVICVHSTTKEQVSRTFSPATMSPLQTPAMVKVTK